MFKGSIVALVTPFRDGAVDEQALGELVEFQIEHGTAAIVPCGTTGESATLDHAEHLRVIRLVIEAVNGRVPVIAGTGSNSTAEAIQLTAEAKELGADASLQVGPYYNKPTQEGFYQHFREIARQVNLPVVLYNVPSRTGKNIEPETIARLSEIGNIVAVKEASGDIDQMSRIAGMCDIAILSGNDSQTLPMLALGATGVISVAANVAPGKCAALVRSWQEGKPEETRRLHFELMPLFDAMFVESNPIPVKAALAEMGMIREEYRLPLCRISDNNRKKLLAALKGAGLV